LRCTGDRRQATAPRCLATRARSPGPPPTTYYRVPMPPSDGSDADFRRRFDEIIAEISPDEIHEILGTLMGAGSISGAQMPRPDLRRAPLGEPTILTVRLAVQ